MSNKHDENFVAGIHPELFANFPEEQSEDEKAFKIYPFRIRCIVMPTRSPRHHSFEYTLGVGRSNIDRAFNKIPITDERPTFVFPERWMTPQETRIFLSYMKDNPNANNWKSVDIITNSPILIGEIFPDSVRIIKFDDDVVKNLHSEKGTNKKGEPPNAKN